MQSKRLQKKISGRPCHRQKRVFEGHIPTFVCEKIIPNPSHSFSSSDSSFAAAEDSPHICTVAYPQMSTLEIALKFIFLPPFCDSRQRTEM